MATPGSGYKIANDLLMEMSFHLVEPVVFTTFTSFQVTGYGDGGYGDGGYGDSQSENPYTAIVGSTVGMYVGAQVIVGPGSDDEEVVTILAVGTLTFTANFVNSHQAGDLVVGATFPVSQTVDPFFAQIEMLSYLSNAQNDYLVRVPLVYAQATQAFASGVTTMAMPADAIQIERVAVNGNALFEQGQTSLDLLAYDWTMGTAGPPRTWFEDRLGLMQYGVSPVPLNAFSANLLYAQRDSALLALNEGFLLPDPFLHYVKYGALAAVFSKDGEQRDPERARYCQGRFDTGVKIGMQFYQNVMEREVTGG